MTHSRTTCLLATLTLLAATSVASAQTSSPPLPVKLGQIVWVTTSEGLDMKGFVSAITPTTLEISGEAGTRQFVVAETRRIAKRDGNRNGFLIGAAIGALPWMLGAAAGDDENCDNKEICLRFTTGMLVTTGLISGAIWGGVGALIDTFIEGRETIYTRPAPALALAPVVSRSGVGVRASIRW
jgi:hypothetical protein